MNEVCGSGQTLSHTCIAKWPHRSLVHGDALPTPPSLSPSVYCLRVASENVYCGSMSSNDISLMAMFMKVTTPLPVLAETPI